MLNKGPSKITIKSREGFTPIIRVESDASFSAYGVSGSKREIVLGPFVSDGRRLAYRLPPGIDAVEVKTAKSTFWSCEIDYQPDGKEYPDPTPLEIPVGAHQPPSLRDEMRRFIREEFSRVASDEGQETFEDADDFDIDDDPDPFSQYEMTDMQEEYPIESPESDSEDADKTNSENPTPDLSGEQKPPTADSVDTQHESESTSNSA